MKVSLTDQAYDKIEEMLVTLKFKPGTIISEPEIIERIGMGRTPVREALLRLGKEHMIKAIPRKGIYINEIHITDHIALMGNYSFLSSKQTDEELQNPDYTRKNSFWEGGLGVFE
ncbi:MAG TPA: GntR family transcriptional regulator, partial [bacterium]|nr:GntR family transcriptional regulator [bacterium]